MGVERKYLTDTSGLDREKSDSLGMWKWDRIFAASGLHPQSLALGPMHSKDSLSKSGMNQRDKAQVRRDT